MRHYFARVMYTRFVKRALNRRPSVREVCRSAIGVQSARSEVDGRLRAGRVLLHLLALIPPYYAARRVTSCLRSPRLLRWSCSHLGVKANVELSGLAETLRAVIREEIERATEGARATESPWLDVEGAAAYAAMTTNGVRSAAKRGQLRSHRSVTGRVRFLRADVDAFLLGNEAA